MNRRDIVLGSVVLLLLAAEALILRRPAGQAPLIPDSTSVPSVEEQIESSFKTDIPDDVEKLELKDVENVGGIAIATRNFEAGKFSAAVLADLSEPGNSRFYQAWITQGDPADENANFILLGTMRVAKGGYVVEYQSNTDYSNYDGFLITLEEKNDNTPEKHLMEGQF